MTTTRYPISSGREGVARERAAIPLLRPVAWHSNHLGGATYLLPTGKLHATYRVQHRCLVGVPFAGLRLLYANPAHTPNAITVKGQVELATNLAYPVTFNGAASVTIPAGSEVLSDPLGLTMDPFELSYFWTSTYVDAGSGRIPVGITTAGGNGEGSNITVTTDGGADLLVTTAGATPTPPPTGTYPAYSPAAVLGVPADRNLPAVAIFGDSIAVGTGDTTPGWATANPPGDVGFIARALLDSTGPNIGCVYQARFGKTVAATFAERPSLGPVLNYCTDMVEEYGTNDVADGTAAFWIEKFRYHLWALAGARGKRVWATTITPRTTSTDSWATVGNQTVQANEATRVAVNTWLRAGAPLAASDHSPVAVGTSGAHTIGHPRHPLMGIFDVADAVESARDSGRWKASYTVDGVHPNIAAHAAMAAIINTGLFAL